MTAFFILQTHSSLQKPTTIVYIDGFNFYYGAVKGTPFKWLDLSKLFTMIRPHDELVAIRYFTAMVNGPTAPNQEVYLQALSTTPLVQPVLGNFKNKRVSCKFGPCSHPGPRFFQVPEEKRTDVNIAVYMIDDAYQNICENFVLVSGDSDLVPAVRLIRSRFPEKKITVYVPAQDPRRGFAVELRSVAHKHRDFPLNLLPHAQFSNALPNGSGGILQKPSCLVRPWAWALPSSLCFLPGRFLFRTPWPWHICRGLHFQESA